MSEQIISNPIMVRVVITLVLYGLLPLLILYIFNRHKWVQSLSSIMMVYIAGLIMAATGIVKFPADSMEEVAFVQWQTLIMNMAIPMAIPLLLFSCDLKLWVKALPKTMWALVGGVVAVLLAVGSGWFLFRNKNIEHLDEVAAMMSGLYTGGTINLGGVGLSLGIDASLMSVVLGFQLMLTIPFLLFLLSGGFQTFRRMLPYRDETTNELRKKPRRIPVPTNEVEDYSGLLTRDNWFLTLAGWGLALLILGIGIGVSILYWKLGFVAPNADNPEIPVMNEMVIILTVTILSVAASFSRFVRSLPKTFESGMLFLLIFLIVVSSSFRWHAMVDNFRGIGMFIFWTLCCGGLLHLLFCRLLRVSGDLYVVSQISLLSSPTFVPPVVAAMGNKKVLLSGRVISMMGGVIGIFLGIGVAWLLSLL